MKNFNYIKNESGFVGVIIAIVVGLFVSGLLALHPLYVYGTQQFKTFTINKSERITDDNGSKYLVYTDAGVFENTDELFRWKFNSSDVYNQLQNGKKYRCDTYGWRLTFFSSYPNVVSCEEQGE